jgi:AbrB family looped-hinge helix DNA binding protein
MDRLNLNKVCINTYFRGEGMFEKIVSVGERGQVTIPKELRDEEGIKPKDKILFQRKNGKNIFKKVKSKKEIEKELAKGYEQMAKISLEVEDEWKYASKEADAMLDDY